MNKRGADKILSMYWFAILIIVAGGVFAMVYNFYSSPYDVRETEADMLTNKGADCISQNGKIDSEFFYEGSFNENISNIFLEKCSFNFETETEYNWDEVPQYFFEVEFYIVDDLENPFFSFYEGNLNYKNDCFITDKKGEEYEKLAKCIERRFYSLGNDEQYLIKILSAVGKIEKNVKQ